MKKIFLSLATIAVIATVAISATRAYFTSEVTVPNITLATGTLHIKDNSADWMSQVTFSNLKPGDLVRKWVTIQNDGTLDVGSVTVTATAINDPSNFLDAVHVWTYGTIDGTSDSPNGEQTGYSTNAKVMLTGNTSLLSTLNPVLHPGQQTRTQVQFVIPASLGNEFQGKTVTFNLVYHAEQVHPVNVE